MSPEARTASLELTKSIGQAMRNLEQTANAPPNVAIDLPALLAWLATDFPGVITAIAKLIGILMTQTK
jgi:hypothetical protein